MKKDAKIVYLSSLSDCTEEEQEQEDAADPLKVLSDLLAEAQSMIGSLLSLKKDLLIWKLKKALIAGIAVLCTFIFLSSLLLASGFALIRGASLILAALFDLSQAVALFLTGGMFIIIFALTFLGGAVYFRNSEMRSLREKYGD